MGVVSLTVYDALGRVIKTIADVGGLARTVSYTYDGDDNRLTVSAKQSGTRFQVTQSIYQVRLQTGSGVNSNDLLSNVYNPDTNTGQPTSLFCITYKVNALGQRIFYADPNGTQHQYTYDVLGRLTSDTITIRLKSLVDGKVVRIDTAYDSQGIAYLFTSYSNTNARVGAVVNEIERLFNGFGQLSEESQSASGPVFSATPDVQYSYANGQNNNSNLLSIVYPSGRTLYYQYDSISRVISVADGENGPILERDTYLGLSTIVQRAYVQAQEVMTYISQGWVPGTRNDGGDIYTGLDRFGRVIDQLWILLTPGLAASQRIVDRFQYWYNNDSNIIVRKNGTNAAFSQTIAYDKLGEMTQLTVGTLNAQNTAVTSVTFQQTWSNFDGLGNCGTTVTINPGVPTQTVTKAFNARNQVISVSTGGAYIYDFNGNLLSQGSTSNYYDGWNRLVSTRGNGIVSQYTFDALGRRIIQTTTANGRQALPVTSYYDSAGNEIQDNLQGRPTYQFVWSPVGQKLLIERDSNYVISEGQLSTRVYAEEDAANSVTSTFLAPNMGLPNGMIMERYVYDGYGTPNVLRQDYTEFPGGLKGRGTLSWQYLFQGGKYGNGAYEFGARDLSPSTGSWLQQDPIGFAGGDPNLYRFVGNDPMTFTDPSGEAWGWAAAAIGAGIGVAGYTVGAGIASAWTGENQFTTGGFVGAAAGGAVGGLIVGALTGDATSAAGLIGIGILSGAASGGTAGLLGTVTDQTVANVRQNGLNVGSYQ
jgi:RHS repeat-associated protein